MLVGLLVYPDDITVFNKHTIFPKFYILQLLKLIPLSLNFSSSLKRIMAWHALWYNVEIEKVGMLEILVSPMPHSSFQHILFHTPLQLPPVIKLLTIVGMQFATSI